MDALLARAMFPDPERIARQRAAYHVPGGPPVFVWEVAGRVVSAAGLHVTGDHAEILHVGTDPAHAGRGYARALLHAVADHLDLTTLSAETDDGAAAFYRRTGFRVEAAPTRNGRARYRCTLTRR